MNALSVSSRRFVVGLFAVSFSAVVLPMAASADPLQAGDGKIFRLSADSLFQQGCFDPCLCPMLEQKSVRGTMVLRFAGLTDGINRYAVSDVNWSVPINDLEAIRVVGGGFYEIGSPSITPVLQHRMVLELHVGDELVQRFDSGWVDINHNDGILITVDTNDQDCWDTVFTIDAHMVPPDQIHPYQLSDPSTFQRGCFDPCDCILEPQQPLRGTFSLVPLVSELFLVEFAVVNVRFETVSTTVDSALRVHGFGIYQMLGDFAFQDRLLLDVTMGDGVQARLDSGLVAGGSPFPVIDKVISINQLECFDTVLHVVAAPDTRNLCGGFAGITCDNPGEFCNLPVGQCCCDVQGVCTPIPTGCPDVWDPVCGCDGVTYGNECEAATAGVSILHTGSCESNACCLPDGICVNIPSELCLAEGGNSVPGADCTLVDCTPTAEGACCKVDPAGITACAITSQDACLLEGGTYLGDNTTCPTDPNTPCELPRGACCMISSTGEPFCFGEMTEMLCHDTGGRYQGDGSICTDTTCLELCGGFTGLICQNPDDFCNFPEGTCGGGDFTGICTTPPNACPEIFDPVCGCDNITYDNKCFAASAGVSVLHVGACDLFACCLPDGTCTNVTPDLCLESGGHSISGTDCTTVDCSVPPVGACCTVDPTGVTTCVLAFQDACQLEGGSYLGDNTTCPTDPNLPCAIPTGACCLTSTTGTPFCFGEMTERQCFEVVGIYQGDGSVCTNTTCPELCGGSPFVVCSNSNDYCMFELGSCGQDDRPGVCTPLPSPGTVCLDVYEPVCGCDNQTYGNACEAEQVGISIRHLGECEVSSCCFTDGSCLDIPADVCLGAFGTPVPGLTCEMANCTPEPTGACCLTSALGLTDCAMATVITCLIEGGTYLGDGSICSDTSCTQRCGGIAGIVCEDPSEFCKFPVGNCGDGDFLGVCTPIPPSGTPCPAIFAPVCGCDGVTYGNECESDAAGVSILHPGECEVIGCVASRFLSNPEPNYCPGQGLIVEIVLTSPAGATAMALEDVPPAGWTVTNISHSGVFDAINGKVKWGPFFAPDIPPVVTYEAMPAGDAVGILCFEGTVSVDGFSRTICGDSCVDHFCCPTLEADSPQAACDACPGDGCTDCNNGCGNGQVNLCELIGYACGWMNGCNDDLSGMTRSAFIWRNGECYCWDETARNWFPTDCTLHDTGCCSSAPGSISQATLVDSVGSAQLSIQRTNRVSKIGEYVVPVTIHAPAGTMVIALEIEVPNGWRVISISDSGMWDDVHGKVKWSPFYDNLSRTVSFTVRPAPRTGLKASRLSRLAGPGSFSGTISFDGVNAPIRIR